MNKVIFMVVFAAYSFSVLSNEMYRAPSSGDSGTYFIVTSGKGIDGIITVLLSRIGKDNAYTDFTKLNVNCVSKKYFELGGSSEDGAKTSPSKPLKEWSNTKWALLVPGSSKSDLVRYVCNKHK